jgi:predicted DNA-binding helix-hairpin-helix protein
VQRLLAARRVRRIQVDDLKRLNVPLKKVLPFVIVAGHRPAPELDRADLPQRLTPSSQASLFDSAGAPL